MAARLRRRPKDLRENPPVWLKEEVAAAGSAKGPFGWLWAMGLLLVAVVRHLAGEAPPHRHAELCLTSLPGPCMKDGSLLPGSGAGPASRAERGRAWAEREETRFRRPRCC